MNENEDGGIEVEASPTFFGSSGGGGGLVEEDEDDIEQLPRQDDESTMDNESTIVASSYISRGYSYVASNMNWILVVIASFAIIFSIGIGLGYGIGDIIYGKDDAPSVSSAMAVEFTASDHGDDGAKSGKSKSDKSKSDKSSGVSCVECVHRFCAYDMNQLPFRCKTTTNQQSVHVVILPSNTDKSREGYSASDVISLELTNWIPDTSSLELTHWITN